jgi:hypothetical protein
VDDVQEVNGDGVEDPGDDDEVHAGPGSVGEERRVTEDMVLQGEAVEDEEHVATPLRVVGHLEVQNDRNKIPDVLDGGGLAVGASDGRSLGDEGVVVVVLGGIVDGTVTVPKGSDLLFQAGGLRVLLLKGVDGGPDALLGSGGGLEEVRVVLGCWPRSALVERREVASASRSLAAARASSRSLEELSPAMGAQPRCDGRVMKRAWQSCGRAHPAGERTAGGGRARCRARAQEEAPAQPAGGRRGRRRADAARCIARARGPRRRGVTRCAASGRAEVRRGRVKLIPYWTKPNQP